MTADQPASNVSLPAILEDLYLGATPDYRNEVISAAVRTRQRPAWTFPGRWFPMSDIASTVYLPAGQAADAAVRSGSCS